MKWLGLILTVLSRMLVALDRIKKDKKQEKLARERDKANADPVRYANDRWVSKPADSGDMPSDSPELDDRRNEP